MKQISKSQALANLLSFIHKHIDDILFQLGIIFLALGGFLIYLPIGFFILGLCFIAYAFIYAQSAAKRGGG